MPRLTGVVLSSPLAVVSLAACVAGATGACAGVKANPHGTTGSGAVSGSGGSAGGGYVAPSIPGLTTLTVSPKTAMVTLSADPNKPGELIGTTQLMASGSINGADQDVSAAVAWSSNYPTGVVVSGTVTLTAPGVYTITASSGSVSDSAMVTANFTGEITGDGFDPSNKATLDGDASGSATLAYPLDRSVFPSNLSPIYAHISMPGQTARLSFDGDGLSVKFYGNCVSMTDAGDPLPGAKGACYVKMPLSLTRLFIASSSNSDIKMTARVSNGGAPAETPPVNVAWANVPLSGGLYYWSTIPNAKTCGGNSMPNAGTYCLLDPSQTSGTAIFRYAFTTDGTDPKPEQIWTDDGGPNSMPPYQGGPQAFVSGKAGGHCIGCHSITVDGKYMALTIGGSSTSDAANFSLLDIAAQSLLVLNPTASSDPNSTPTVDSTDYWKKFRVEGVATQNAWNPGSTLMLSMFQSKLYLTQVAITGTSGTATRVGPAFPTSNSEYQTDPFWSPDGKYVVFTSFTPADKGMYNDTGLNGDMKRYGKICLADATPTGVMDNARELVGRSPNTSYFYPAINSDSSLVVFNQSTCGSDPDSDKGASDYGSQTCDGYDDSSAKLMLVKLAGGTPKSLDLANGNGAYANSWPRWSPDKGTFRGQDLHWVAFSSRRPYGTQLNMGGGATTKPQLWIAGVSSGAEFGAKDPSFAPVWLPTQNQVQASPTGNHVPQWVRVAVKFD